MIFPGQNVNSREVIGRWNVSESNPIYLYHDSSPLIDHSTRLWHLSLNFCPNLAGCTRDTGHAEVCAVYFCQVMNFLIYMLAVQIFQNQGKPVITRTTERTFVLNGSFKLQKRQHASNSKIAKFQEDVDLLGTLHFSIVPLSNPFFPWR